MNLLFTADKRTFHPSNDDLYESLMMIWLLIPPLEHLLHVKRKIMSRRYSIYQPEVSSMVM